MQPRPIFVKVSNSVPKYKRYSTMAPVKTQAAARDFLSFVNASPTPYHAVKSAKERLTKAGFKEIRVRRFLPVNDTTNMSRRRKNHGLRPANQVGNTTLPEMARLSLHLRSGRSGGREMDLL